MKITLLTLALAGLTATSFAAQVTTYQAARNELLAGAKMNMVLNLNLCTNKSMTNQATLTPHAVMILPNEFITSDNAITNLDPEMKGLTREVINYTFTPQGSSCSSANGCVTLNSTVYSMNNNTAPVSYPADVCVIGKGVQLFFS